MKKVLVLVMLAGMLAVTNAALFTEDWSSGTVDPAIWYETADVYHGTDNLFVVDPLGNGDYALEIGKATEIYANPLWGDQLVTNQSWGRSSGLTVTYKVWNGDPANTAIGIYGGFWHTHDPGAVYDNGEAAIGYVWNALAAYEKGEQVAYGVSPVMPLLNVAIANALSKDTAITVKITMDPVQGATWEWSDNDGATWTMERNTLGTGTSDTPMLYVGFGGHHDQGGVTMIDDIVVTPEPATIALLSLGAFVIRRRKQS